jgi:hypothetical protein
MLLLVLPPALQQDLLEQLDEAELPADALHKKVLLSSIGDTHTHTHTQTDVCMYACILTRRKSSCMSSSGDTHTHTYVCMYVYMHLDTQEVLLHVE